MITAFVIKELRLLCIQSTLLLPPFVHCTEALVGGGKNYKIYFASFRLFLMYFLVVISFLLFSSLFLFMSIKLLYFCYSWNSEIKKKKKAYLDREGIRKSKKKRI